MAKSNGLGRWIVYNNCTNSEMGHLYYTELGNVEDNTYPYYGLQNTGDFQNLTMNWYWSGTEHSTYPLYAWLFDNGNGTQGVYGESGSLYAIAVRSGRAIVPEPISSILFIVGGAALGFRRFRKAFKK